MKYTKKILFLLILVCYSIFSCGNIQYNLNQLVKEIKNKNEDKEKYANLLILRDSLSNIDIDTAIVLWKELGIFFEETDYPRGTGYCFRNLARLLRRKGEYFKSYQAYQRSIDNAGNSGDIWNLAAAYNGLGSLFSDLNQPTKSFDNYIKSIELFKSINDTVWEGSVYLNLGGMLEEQDSLHKAKIYLKESEKLLKTINHHNLINCYINLGIVFEKEACFDSAGYYFSESYKLSKIKGDIGDTFNGTFYMGKFLFEQEKILEAEPFLEEAKLLIENPESKSDLYITDLAEFTKLLGNFYAAKEDFFKAYYYLSESSNYQKQIKLEETNRELWRINFEKLELESKTKQQRKDNFIALSLIGLLFSLIVLLSIFRSYKHKQKANLLLTEMDELKTRLYSNFTHELRTPLTLIIGRLEQILSSDAKKKPSESQIRLMRRNANSILTLINQMLDLSKIDAKSLKLELIKDDIVAFIKVHFVSFASLAERKNIIFNSYFLSEKTVVLFDAGKLEKIINNLVSNAIKFTSDGGEVFCNASFSKPNVLQISIQDTGKGIPQDQLDKIFNRFHQVKGANANNPGTGIGLSLTKELVELMHGKITVDSVIEKGTKFMVQIPLGTEHLQTDEYEIVEKDTYIPQTKPMEEDISISTICENHINDHEEFPLVLVVEDHEEISSFIQENLQKCYKVDTAENGTIGIEKALENIPDLIISDVMMPEMDGIEMTVKLKLDERTSHIPVILLTAKISEQDKITGLETGADAFITKPFSIKELSLRVNKLIEQRRKLRERFTANLKLEPKDIAVTSADEKFLNRAMEIIEANIGNADFEVRNFQEDMLMSRMQLFRKIKALTNQTPGEFIRTIRLKRAAYLMDKHFGNIAQITFEVGFNNPSYFAKCFKELYGMLPSEYIKDAPKN